MKMNKKKVLSLSLVIVLIAILSLGSLAWFNDKDEVTNKFMVASSEEDTPDEIFSIDLFEKVDTNGDGDSKEVGRGDGDPSPVYKDMLPGEVRTKQPTVKNTGTYDQYVRVIVTLDNADDWQEMAERYNLDLNALFVDINSNDWMYDDTDPVYNEENKTYTFTFYYQHKLEKNDEATLFTAVKIPGELTQEDMVSFDDNQFSMHIVAEAVQTENLGENVNNAKDAFAFIEGN